MNLKVEEIDEETITDAFEAEEPEAELEDEAQEVSDDEGSDTEAEAKDADEDEGFVAVTIGGEAPPPEDEEAERAPEWVRDLRKQYREEKRRNKELQEQLARTSGSAKAAELGEKPTLEKADYDTERYETELAAWYERKRKHDEVEAARRSEADAVEREWKQKLEGYQSAKATLKVRDYDEAEDVVQDALNVTQQGMILQGAENPALLVYALGKNPKRAKELASIKDPVKFAFAVARLETQLKVTKRKATSKPEPKVSGTGRISGAVDSTLERLRA
ncbi:MAG TPA: hypothetical protein VIG24_06665, partial [Acidimicrobiia bacterium]